MIREVQSQLWEVLVPTHSNIGDEFEVEFHSQWDDQVREITGGLTIMRTARGQWEDETGQLFAERMIPVRVACSEDQVRLILELTLRHYGQKAVMAYLVSERALIFEHSPEES